MAAVAASVNLSAKSALVGSKCVGPSPPPSRERTASSPIRPPVEGFFFLTPSPTPIAFAGRS